MDLNGARTILEQEARRLDQAAAQLDDPTATDTHLPELEEEFALRDRIDAERRAVADALARVAAGTYGTCATCGSAIAPERLEAVPATRFCRDHELAAETLLESQAVEGVDGGRGASEELRREAQRNLDLVPEDETPDDTLDDDRLGPEELAVHVRPEG